MVEQLSQTAPLILDARAERHNLRLCLAFSIEQIGLDALV
jgi:hypothetical protein